MQFNSDSYSDMAIQQCGVTTVGSFNDGILFQCNSLYFQDEVNPMKLEHFSSFQPESAPVSNPSPRPSLIARWDIENGKLVCRWIVDDRPRKPSVH